MFMFFVVSMFLGVIAGVGFTLALLWMSNPVEFEGFILMVTWEWGLIKKEIYFERPGAGWGNFSYEYVTWDEANGRRFHGFTSDWCWRWQTPPDDDCDGDVDETDDGCFCDN